MAISDKEYMNMLNDMQESNNRLAQFNADKANQFTWKSQMESERFNAQEAQKNRSFQLSMSNTAHQRETIDLIRAGLNPVLSANNGASVTSGATASVGSSSGIKADIDMQKAQLYSQYLVNKINNANQIKINKMNNRNALQMARISAAASMYGADASSSAARFGAMQAAAASMYGANQAYNASIYGYDKQYDIAQMNNDTSKYNNQTTNFQNYLNNYNRNKGNLWWNISNGLDKALGLKRRGHGRSF